MSWFNSGSCGSYISVKTTIAATASHTRNCSLQCPHVDQQGFFHHVVSATTKQKAESWDLTETTWWSSRGRGQCKLHPRELGDGLVNALPLSTTLMRYNGVLWCELDLWGQAGAEGGGLWLFTDVLYPIIFMLSGGRNGKQGLNGAFHIWSNSILTSGS